MFHNTSKRNEIIPDANKSVIDKQEQTAENTSDKSTAEMQSDSQQPAVQTVVVEPEKKGKFKTLKVSPPGNNVLMV
jgi:hypothetical protein